MVTPTYTFSDAVRLTRAKRTQLIYWTQAPLITAGIREAAGRGHHRVLSYANLIELSIAVGLARQGVKLRGIRTVLKMVRLPRRPPRKPLDQLVFLMGDPADPNATWVGRRDQFISGLRTGAVIIDPVGILVDVGRIVQDLDDRMREIT